MQIAIKEAEKAAAKGEVPVGAVIIDPHGEVLAKAHNTSERHSNPLKHAELIAIEKALKKLNLRYLDDCSIYVTLEPCAMCAQAISYVRVPRLYFGAYDVKFGAIENNSRIFATNKTIFKPEVYGGISENTCSKILKDFFIALRFDR